jgi:hypothetical protein
MTQLLKMQFQRLHFLRQRLFQPHQLRMRRLHRRRL